MKFAIDLSIEEKTHKKKGKEISLLKDFSLSVSEGEKIAVVGKSGAGKSTLLNILGLIDLKYSGSYDLFGTSTKSLSSSKLASWRNHKIGFVLQESALIDSLSLEDNIKLPLMYSSPDRRRECEERFEKITHDIDIDKILKKKPNDCSGGEKARAVFARGIIMNPAIILSDEPTASLDPENSDKVIQSLFEMNEKFNTTLITVTHNVEEAKRYDRIITIERA